MVDIVELNDLVVAKNLDELKSSLDSTTNWNSLKDIEATINLNA